ncbi:SO_0444 family Cu/Zn efflux transporter [Salidesulfovibrio onnuriiensis]|uniref:SO_0444 family Cu/Zn efflux transporter n=1 Tax=Salidesulfovibrio onnuriiensis TaxID=2583823 RepID=UPI0011CCD598|nr:SO_0444 family Cu/Zn efflux transporter [Salidesulfovibrio onnuriiensis]
MEDVSVLFLNIVAESWHVLVDASPYVLLGFFVAGLLKAVVPDSFMARHLGGRSFWSVLKAALIGVPLPLCSCGVLPAAMGLRRQGAGKGAATAFMISTPETGVDSIAITYALMDPVMTVARPVAAFITAILAGILVNVFPEDDSRLPLEALVHTGHNHGCGCQGECGHQASSVWQRFKGGMDFAFGEMISDIGRWLLLGVLIAGVIAAVVPADFIERYVGQGFLSLLIMLVVGLPLYVCATASTPIAASLLLKGLSPGAALVFLLAGPATNGATITVMLKVLGKRAAMLYLAAIAVSSLALGWLVDRIYDHFNLDIRAVIADAGEVLPEWFGILCALVLLGLIVWSYLRKGTCDCCH